MNVTPKVLIDAQKLLAKVAMGSPLSSAPPAQPAALPTSQNVTATPNMAQPATGTPQRQIPVQKPLNQTMPAKQAAAQKHALKLMIYGIMKTAKTQKIDMSGITTKLRKNAEEKKKAGLARAVKGYAAKGRRAAKKTGQKAKSTAGKYKTEAGAGAVGAAGGYAAGKALEDKEAGYASKAVRKAKGYAAKGRRTAKQTGRKVKGTAKKYAPHAGAAVAGYGTGRLVEHNMGGKDKKKKEEKKAYAQVFSKMSEDQLYNLVKGAGIGRAIKGYANKGRRMGRKAVASGKKAKNWVKDNPGHVKTVGVEAAGGAALAGGGYMAGKSQGGKGEEQTKASSHARLMGQVVGWNECIVPPDAVFHKVASKTGVEARAIKAAYIKKEAIVGTMLGGAALGMAAPAIWRGLKGAYNGVMGNKGPGFKAYDTSRMGGFSPKQMNRWQNIMMQEGMRNRQMSGMLQGMAGAYNPAPSPWGR